MFPGKLHPSGAQGSIYIMDARPEHIVIGGGEWGCYHVERLLRALRSGRLAPALVHVVDRDPECAAVARFGSDESFRFSPAEWLPFLLDFLAEGRPPVASRIVPSPHAPHLFLDWLQAYIGLRAPRARLSREPFEAELSLPFQYADAHNNLFLSAAAWRCPVSCREPRICPAIKARRSWELGDIIRARAESQSAPMLPIIWKSTYFCPGVAGVLARELLDAARMLLGGKSAQGQAAVATVSACHGVVGVLEYDLLPEGPNKCV